MVDYPTFLIITLFFYSLTGLVMSLKKCKNDKCSFEHSSFFLPLGAFVWGDVVVFSGFWLFVSLLTLYTQDFLLFILILSVFWMVRSGGEVLYWFMQQFSTLHRNPPEKLLFHSVFHNDSIWFVYQIFWQCILVFTIISTIYLSALWLHTILLW